MRRFLILGAIMALSACADMSSPPLATTAPATPVFFQPYSVALDKPALDAIAAAAVTAAERPEARIIVLGAADAGGNTQANILLSKTRARIVADQLIADGVGPGRIRARGLGEESAPEASAQSARRVVIRIEG
jgi:outer membrane protein OmpA-like peptidoglycan-associated protein